MTPLQDIELEMYKQVRDICTRHNLRHYALGGTLLGAVRHKGFIPWDDDIDIAIPRPDYNKFIKYAKEELPENLIAKTYLDEKDDKHPIFICSIKNTDTKIELNFANKTEYTNVWLDVFPLDAMPDNIIIRNLKKYKLLFQRMKIQFSMYDENVHQHREGRPIYERALMKFRECTNLGATWNTFNLMKQIDKTLQNSHYDECGYVVNMFGAYKFKEMFPKKWFGEGIEIPFEDTFIPCPVEFDKVLTQMYGEYMQLPPIEQRGQQHCMKIISLGGGQ
jgi:lipopolysaccharide cholinephosphotransferase